MPQVKTKVSTKPKVAPKKAVAVKKAPKVVKVASKARSTSSVRELPKETGLKLSVYGITGKVLESITLPKEVFGLEENKALVAQAVRVFLANQRQGNAKTKSRGEVNISTRKIYRQKGTGRARHGAASAPIFVGGGVAFGPRPHDFSMKLTKSARKKALFTALSSKLKNGEIKLVSGLEKLEPKTKKMADVISKFENSKKRNLLLVTPDATDKYSSIVKSARNIEGVQILPSNLLNTYEVLRARQLLLMKEVVNALKESSLK